MKHMFLVLSLCLLLPAIAGEGRKQQSLPDGRFGCSKWDKCKFAAAPSKLTKTHCNNPKHYNAKHQHYFTLGESKLDGGDVLK